MKELSIEEKAKAYDELIKRLNKAREDVGGYTFKSVYDEVMSELAESEDEKIRKDILTYLLQSANSATLKVNAQKFNKWIAWLEKQGEKGINGENREIPFSEQNPADKVEPKFRIGDIIKDTEDGEVFTIRTITKDKYIYTDDSFDWIKDQDEYELVEQKPADKVEPKFREGEWVVSPNGVYWHIDKISNNRYEVTSNIGESSNWPLDTNIYHSFSIQDAKDSDVLAVEPIEDYQYPFVAIYKEHGLDFFNSYCFIGFDGKFYEADTGHSTEKIHPATKEQRDQLEKAMTDAGYTFDFEKKELKKIEQKPVEWSEEDKNMLNQIINSGELHCYLN